MSLATLEREILSAAKKHFNNPKLRLKDLREWSTAEIKPENDKEVVDRVTASVGKVYVCIFKELDKRTS